MRRAWPVARASDRDPHGTRRRRRLGRNRQVEIERGPKGTRHSLRLLCFNAFTDLPSDFACANFQAHFAHAKRSIRTGSDAFPRHIAPSSFPRPGDRDRLIAGADAPRSAGTPCQDCRHLSLRALSIRESIASRLTARADPAPARFDDIGTEQIARDMDVVAPADVAAVIDRHQCNRLEEGRGVHPQDSSPSASSCPTRILNQWRPTDSNFGSQRFRAVEPDGVPYGTAISDPKSGKRGGDHGTDGRGNISHRAGK